jgi:hypothetical protein
VFESAEYRLSHEGGVVGRRISPRQPLSGTAVCPTTDKQAATHSILSLYSVLYFLLSIIPKQNLSLQHSEVRANIRTLGGAQCSRAKQVTDHIHTMQEPATAPWSVSISHADFMKLKAGFEPQNQVDKWHYSITH